MNAKLKAILVRIETWPDEAQAEVANLLLALEQEYAEPYELTDDDKAAVDRGLADATAGRFATAEQIEVLFAKYR